MKNIILSIFLLPLIAVAQNPFNTSQRAIVVTTNGTSGPSTLNNNVLNIPQYSGGGGLSTPLADNTDLFKNNTDATKIIRFSLSGLTTSTTRTWTFPDNDGTFLYSGGPLGTPSSATLTNATGLPISGIAGLGTGVGTWLGTPSWTNFNSAITGTAPYWSLASGGTLTGANTITGTVTNTFKMVFSNLNTTQTDGAGIYLQNPTAAAAGAQQISPGITFEGNGWASTGGSSQVVKVFQDILPVQGATSPSVTWRLRSSINGAAYSDLLTLNNGTFNFPNGLSLQTSGVTRMTVVNAGGGAITFTQTGVSSGWSPAMTFTPGANTGMTAGSEFKVNVFTGSIQTWLAGSSTLATQRYTHFTAPTVNAGSGNTITDTYTMSIDDPVNGSGTTTNLWSLGVGKLRLGGVPKFAGTNTTGAGSAALGSNSPATTNTAPYTWIQVTTSDGSTGYIPVWK